MTSSEATPAGAGIKRRSSKWRAVVLVCRTCSKKARGGFGPKGRTPLAKALRKRLGLPKGRRAPVGFVEVGCLGVCAKNAVTVACGACPGRLLAVPKGAPLDAVAAALGVDEAVGAAALSRDRERHALAEERPVGDLAGHVREPVEDLR